ncbi:MAG: acyl-ACP--UDP-N-acetylglucosamine O-acyltransferase [Muribaculaceae bacterium]|nr:acyl-ACP--UDP-N-acetylglucosamine O-acyltransferase [Muribaculaceae bacterium]
MNSISSLAFIHPDAKIGDNVTIDAFAFIDKDVEIKDGCHIFPHATLRAGTRLEENVSIFEGAIIAAIPQDFRWKGDESFVKIGRNTIIRENVIINRSIHAGGATVVGNDSFILAQTHIGHDSAIGDHCVLGNAVRVAGNCRVGDFTILSSNSLIHENCHVGRWVLVKGGCRVNNNVPPFTIMAHNPITYCGINAFILRKGEFTEEQIDDIARCYRHLYQSNTSVFNALKRMKSDVRECVERDEIIDFIEAHDQKIASAKSETDFFD